MPNKYQRVVTVPIRVWNKVLEEVNAGRERSVADTFVRAADEYLRRKRYARRKKEANL